MPRKTIKVGRASVTTEPHESRFIERRIITGLIISTDYIRQIRTLWNPRLLTNHPARTIATWCIEHFDKYGTAPGRDIESILQEKSKKFKKKDQLKDFENILADLSDDYARSKKFNVPYLVDQTRNFLNEQNIDSFIEDIQSELQAGNLEAAKNLIYNFRDLANVEGDVLDFSDRDQVKKAVIEAFKTQSQKVVRYARQLGAFLNDELVRGGFVAFMGPEKRGKTFLLLDIATKAAMQGSCVAFFQAGDMTRSQQVIRIGVHFSKKSNKKKFCGIQYEPVRDCIKNQLDTCDLEERESDFGIFDDMTEEEVKQLTQKDLIEAYEAKENRRYRSCHNCDKYWSNKWGAPWLKKVNVKGPLTKKEAYNSIDRYLMKHNRRFKLATYPTQTLTVNEIYAQLDSWEKTDGFVPDVIIVDYVDIMASEIKGDVRHQENDKWAKLRGLSQSKHALVVTGTQSDANSYTKDTINASNFSEDKRKFAHVTAFYGMNQDTRGREKKIGIMRLNKIVVREDEFIVNDFVYVLQNLKRGQPCLSSYF